MWPGNPFLHRAWLDAHAEVLEPELTVERWEGVDCAHRGDGPLRLLGDRLSDRLDLPLPSLRAALDRAAARGASLRRLPLATAEALAATPGARIAQVDPSPIVDFAGGSWGAYLDGSDVRRRRRIAAQAERLLARPDAEVADADTADAIGPALVALTDLHHRRFGHRSQSFEPAKVACLATALPAMADDGAAAIRLLHLDGRPVAALLLLLGEDAVWFHQSGWDPAFADLNVGRALLAESMRRACDGGLRFHLLCGEHEYKTWWATGDEPVATVEVAPC